MPSRIFNSAVVEVTPSRIFNSVAVEVTPSRILSSAVVDVMPSRTESSVEVTSDTATFPEPFEVNALEAVRSLVAIVVAAPDMVAFFASSCVCMLDVTPSI